MIRRTAQEVFHIAELHERAGRSAQALELFLKIAEAVPDNLDVLQKIAALSSKLGQTPRAVDSYRRIIANTDKPIEAAGAAVALADILFETDPEEAIAVLRTGISASQPAASVERLSVLVRLVEWKARADRGLPVHHALSFDEVPFAFALPELSEFVSASQRLRQLYPAVPGITLMAICAAAAARDHDSANRLAQELGRLTPVDPHATMRFGEAFPAAINDLPTVTTVRNVEHHASTLMLSCDAAYFIAFGLPLLRSLAGVAPGADVHVHLMASDARIVEFINGLDLKASCSMEDPTTYIQQHSMLPAHYYGAVRFIRFAEVLENSSQPLWMSDADALVVNDPRPLFNSPADAALRIRAGRIEPWHQFSACLVMGSPAARPYYREVANVIRASMPKLWWGIDQFALYSAYLALGTSLPRFLLLGPDAVSLDFRDDAYFWVTAGGAKKALLTSTDAPVTPYEELYRKYRS